MGKPGSSESTERSPGLGVAWESSPGDWGQCHCSAYIRMAAGLFRTQVLGCGKTGAGARLELCCPVGGERGEGLRDDRYGAASPGSGQKRAESKAGRS